VAPLARKPSMSLALKPSCRENLLIVLSKRGRIVGPVLVDDRLDLGFHVGANFLDDRLFLGGQDVHELVAAAKNVS
jgi:hypothetical protein